MFSGHLSKWIFVIALILLALYAAYPPMRVAEKQVRCVETPEGEKEETVVFKRFLPLARGKRDEEVRVLERRDDGTVVKMVTTYVNGRIKLGLDIDGGTELVYQLKTPKGDRFAGKMSDTIEILRARIDPGNIREFRVQPLGHNRILIQVPRASASEVDRLKERMVRMGLLEFKLAVPRGSEDQKFTKLYEQAESGPDPQGYERMYVDDDRSTPYILVEKGDARITGRRLAGVYPTRDQYARPAVGFRFDARGARTFAMVTERHQLWLLAIVLDGKLKSAPVIQERIAGEGQISGNFTAAEVNEMVAVLRAGSLPVDLELLEESTVDPQLGQDSIRKGLTSIFVGALLVLIGVGIYYLICGCVADGALILNLVLLVGVLGLLGAALTLPGLAGILLTVGIAVDANVLIFERIREERATGKPMHIALANGFDRAYTTIVDANVTTLLTAIILYVVGTGPVRGFAVTLSAGIVLSMFTALFVTRLALETLIAKGVLKEFKMFSALKNPAVQFSRVRRVAYVASGIAVLVGMVAFFGRGSALYDIDFTGGSLIRLKLGTSVSVDEVRSRLAEAGFARAEVQGMHGAGERGKGATDFTVRVKGVGIERVRQTMLPEITERLDRAELGKCTPKVRPDGRSLDLSFAEKVTEKDVRGALAAGGQDIFNLKGIREIIPEASLTTDTFLVRTGATSALVDERALWADMLRALAWANAKKSVYIVDLGEVSGGAGAEATSAATLKLTTDEAVSWQVLAREMARRKFPNIEVAPLTAPSKDFTLVGSRQALNRFKQEIPGEFLLPQVTIEGRSATVHLEQAYSEEDLRTCFEQQGIEDVTIVPLGKGANNFRVEFSQERIRQKVESIFRDLGQKAVAVEFEELAEKPAAAGKVRVSMKLSKPMPMRLIAHHVEQAGLGAQAAEVIEHEVAPDVEASAVTLVLPAAKRQMIQQAIEESFATPQTVLQVVSIGSTVAEEMTGRALLAVIFASIIIVLYVAVRFHAFKFGIAAVVALLHDIMITAGLIALADWSGVMGEVKIGLPMVAAFLTILGYSLNDTIVVFDRIRENMGKMGRRDLDEKLIDLSVNQTLNRTLLTSLSTLLVVVVLYLMGGAVLQGLAFTLIVGVVVGTYSSVFIASPVLLEWDAITKGTGLALRVLFSPVTLPFRLIRTAKATK